jgi:hypothetical protein
VTVNIKKAQMRIEIELDVITWFAVQANVSLALRHPQNIGPSASYASFARNCILEALLESGFISADEAAKIRGSWLRS